ncbi:MAG: alpha-mannosidase [Clostridia bacterium]|nr:alpha-mannosidase [Clostridia bacterium]
MSNYSCDGFTYDKVKKITDILNENRVLHHAPVNQVLYYPCDYKVGNNMPDLSLFAPYNIDGKWGRKQDDHAWFYIHVSRPAEMMGEILYLSVSTDKSGWDADNPQFIGYVNGKMQQGLDLNHTDILLGKEEEYDVYLYAYTGPKLSRVELRVSLFTKNDAVEKLYYDLLVPRQVLDFLDVHSYEYATILSYLDKAVDHLNLLKIPSAEFYQSVSEAEAYIQREFYEKYCHEQDATTICIGHTHIDCAWLWTLQQTREKVQRSFSTVIELMKRYPEYKFMSSQALLYKDAKEEAPELYEEIKKMVAAGRWEVEGAMWVEADCNLSSGESLVRQVMYGKRFFRDEFGVNSHILWLPDVFGYSAALPQILRKSDVDWFVTSKISWNETNMMPCDTFSWKGIDGTEINSFFLTPQNRHRYAAPSIRTTYVGDTNAPMIAGTYNRYQQKDLSNEAILTYGYGDGGGGPTAEHIELMRRTAYGIPGCPNAKSEFASDALARLARKINGNPKLPKWQGELYLELHRGTLTGIAKNKRNNRKSEQLYQTTEWLTSMANVLANRPFPKAKLHEGWEMILTNQFHDIIPGSSIFEVYEDCDRDYAKIRSLAESEMNESIAVLLGKIKADGKHVVFNPHSFTNSGVVKADGRSYYVPSIPAKGYAVVDLENQESSVKICGRSVDTPFYAMEFDENYNITRLYDKKNDREVLKKDHLGNRLRIYQDNPYNWDGWEMSEYHKDKVYFIDTVSSVETIDEGARTGIRLTRPHMASEIVQTIWLYNDLPRIDFETHVDWHEQHQLLKVAFPVDVNTDHATYEIQFGTVERPTHKNTSWDAMKFEVCGHKYADLSDNGYGVSLLNDCKYGHDIHDGLMQLTLIKCATYPNPYADQGKHEFTYSLYPHAGNLCMADTVRLAYDLNMPMMVCEGKDGDGTLPQNYSMISCNSDNVIVETIKESEDGNDLIVRMYETKNMRTKVKLILGFDAKSVDLCNLMEVKQGTLSLDGHDLTLTVNPFEIVTLRIKK